MATQIETGGLIYPLIFAFGARDGEINFPDAENIIPGNPVGSGSWAHNTTI